MWVFDKETLQFIDVNDAAISHYGYSREQFLSMTILDIKPADESLKRESVKIKNQPKRALQHPGEVRHRKSNGDIIQVEIQNTSIQYRGKAAGVILANDITERQNYIRAIEQQNEKLKSISWMQSHVVRAPLAKLSLAFRTVSMKQNPPWIKSAKKC